MCDGLTLYGAAGCLLDGTAQVAEHAGQVVSFATDPFGYIFNVTKDAALSLIKDVLPGLSDAIQPDLSMEFFINAYRISFAAAILTMVIVILVQTMKTASGRISGRDLFESFTQYAPMFIGGAMYGPLAGTLIVSLVHELTDSIVKWALGSVDQIVQQMMKLLGEITPAAVPGGVVVATSLVGACIIALLVVVVILIVQLVTLYFSGALIPLALVLLLDPERRHLVMGTLGLWVGILLAHPALFFFLGIAFSMNAAIATQFASGGKLSGVGLLINAMIAIIALFMAAFSPLLMMKFAPFLQQALTPPPPSFGGPREVLGAVSVTAAAAQYGSNSNSATPAPAPAPTGNTAPTGPTTPAPATADQTATATLTNSGTGPATAAPESATAAGAEATTAAEASSTSAGAALGPATLAVGAAVAAGEAAKSSADSLVDHTVAPMGGGS
jgi:hypothetical protein